ncbi:MAG: glycosyltransferase [Rhizobiales bacterium]|nr:glycosyltransferase [Hyphomicrobiales bacterium]
MRLARTVAVIIPALDEEKAIARVIADIPAWVDRIVVVDNGSRDRTGDVALAAGAEVVLEPARGYGSACLRGMAETATADIIVFIDGDHADHAEAMADLVDPIARGDADFVIGSRALGRREPGSLTPQQIFGNRLACWLMRLIWGVRHTDLGPFRAIARGALDGLRMADRNYGWTVEMQIRAAERGLRTLEVPVDYRARIGVSKVSGTVKGTVLAGYKILFTITRFALFSRARRRGYHR